MSSILKAADLAPDAFVGLIRALSPPPEEQLRLWAEGPDGWCLSYWKGLDGNVDWCGAGRASVNFTGQQALERSNAGRLFCPSGELRWRQLAQPRGPVRTVYLGSKDWVGVGLASRQELNGLTASTARVVLWGLQSDNTPNEWVELRIPHRFTYPVGKGRGVRAVVEAWVDEVGEPHFIRLCDLEPYTPKEEKDAAR